MYEEDAQLYVTSVNYKQKAHLHCNIFCQWDVEEKIWTKRKWFSNEIIPEVFTPLFCG